MAVYDNNYMNRMRYDAMRRSQEMHRHSMVNSAHYSQGKKNDIPDNIGIMSENKFSHQNKAEHDNEPLLPKKDNQLFEMISKLFDEKLDSDKLIIIALMIILAKEGADLKLIIALGYILL